MKITVLGATGGTGRAVVEQALARGWDVTAYVRSLGKLTPQPRLAIAPGQLDEASKLAQTLQGQDAVLCCLGVHELRHVRIMQDSLPRITAAMQAAGCQRLVLLSAYGVGESANSAHWFARLLYKTVVKNVYADKAVAERALPATGLAVTLVLPVILKDGDLTGEVDVRPLTAVRRIKGLPKVSRKNVAKVMLDCVADASTVGQKVVVSAAGTVV